MFKFSTKPFLSTLIHLVILPRSSYIAMMNLSSTNALTIRYEDQSLILEGDRSLVEGLTATCDVELVYDSRIRQFRSRGSNYRKIIEKLYQEKIAVVDRARTYTDTLNLSMRSDFNPRKHQTEALSHWLKNSGRGCVSLPTGAGKTVLAYMAMAKVGRPTLIVVPTIDLLHQWRAGLKDFFGIEVGSLGGGQHDIKPVTVSTYDSAALHLQKIGSAFGLVVFDECHHLGGETYLSIAENGIFPFRLGLSATFERTDAREHIIYDLVGPLVYEGHLHSMVGKSLSPFDVVTIEVSLTADERSLYDSERKIYLDFVREKGIQFDSDTGWMDFVFQSSISKPGKRAMQAFRTQKKLAQSCREKLNSIWSILQKHSLERIIIFTNDNDLAYTIGERFFLAVLTHKTSSTERAEMLAAFRSGKIHTLVSSKVLNEGVDVPEASVAIVASGSGAVREHVQRLGRVLRHASGKRAVMYELVAKNTSETQTNKRRKNHHAYQGSSQHSSY